MIPPGRSIQPGDEIMLIDGISAIAPLRPRTTVLARSGSSKFAAAITRKASEPVESSCYRCGDDRSDDDRTGSSDGEEAASYSSAAEAEDTSGSVFPEPVPLDHLDTHINLLA
jgi:hypothetical protein